MTRRLAGRLIAALLLCYPPAWRHRYGDELAGLLAETSLSPRAVADVAAAGIRQRAYAARQSLNGGFTMTIGPAWRHPTAFGLLAAALLLPTFILVGGSLLAYQLDVQPVRLGLEPILVGVAGWGAANLYLVTAPVLAAVAAFAPLVRVGLNRGRDGLEANVIVRARALNVSITLLAVALGAVLVWHTLAEAILEAGR